MRVDEVMVTSVITVAPSDDIARAEELMAAAGVRHLPVLDRGTLVGIVSQRDVLRATLPITSGASDEEDREHKRKIEVATIMRGLVETVRPDTDLWEAATRLLEYKIGCLP